VKRHLVRKARLFHVPPYCANKIIGENQKIYPKNRLGSTYRRNTIEKDQKRGGPGESDDVLKPLRGEPRLDNQYQH